MRPLSADDFDEESEQWVRDQLASQPRPVMPAFVRDRIEQALADEVRTRAPAGAPPERPAAGRGWLGVAAAAAVVLLAGAVFVVPRLSGPTASTSTPAPAAEPPATTDQGGSGPCGVTGTPSADLSPVMHDTGTTYRAASFRQQARELLPPQTCAATFTATGTDQRATEADLVRDCVVTVAQGRTVLAVDKGWAAKREIVTVVLTPPVQALAVDCNRQPIQVLYSTALS